MSLRDMAGTPVSIPLVIPTEEDFSLACRHVLFHFEGDRELGLQAGGFITSLMDVMAHADDDNLAKLSLGFPALAVCVGVYKNQPNGVEKLRAMATPNPHPSAE